MKDKGDLTPSCQRSGRTAGDGPCSSHPHPVPLQMRLWRQGAQTRAQSRCIRVAQAAPLDMRTLTHRLQHGPEGPGRVAQVEL